jgi:RNA polymerase sigma factor for flagellar operon FliA
MTTGDKVTRTKAGRASSDDILQLWKQYKESGDARVRDRLVLSLAPLVKYIVYRKIREIPARCDVEDFISCGLEALIRSIDRYDPERGATLEQFAWTRIHGAVLDELRRNDWAPRSLRRWERDIGKARERFIGIYGRMPTKRELSESVMITPEELDQRLGDIARSDVGSLNVLVLGEEDTSIERIDTLPSTDRDWDPDHHATREAAIERFREVFDRLPARDRQVAILLYVDGLTLREIGEVLGVTESRVCQIHSQLKKRLRVQLQEDEQLFSEVA